MVNAIAFRSLLSLKNNSRVPVSSQFVKFGSAATIDSATVDPLAKLSEVQHFEVGPYKINIGFGKMTDVPADANVLFHLPSEISIDDTIREVMQNGGGPGLSDLAREQDSQGLLTGVLLTRSGDYRANAPIQIHTFARTKVSQPSQASGRVINDASSHFETAFSSALSFARNHREINSIVIGLSEMQNNLSPLSPEDRVGCLIRAMAKRQSDPKPMTLTFVVYEYPSNKLYHKKATAFYSSLAGALSRYH